VSRVREIQEELQKLSAEELREIRDWLDDVIEDGLQFTETFESSLQESERQMNQTKNPM
jgi:hypothetical protein